MSRTGVLNTDPDGIPSTAGSSGNGIWQSGNGPAVDANGNIYVATGNGPFDTNLTGGFPTHRDFGDSVLKISPALSVADYFAPFDQANSSANDTDLGSGGPMLVDIRDSGNVIHHLLVQSGKDTNLYVLDRNNLGKFNPNNNSQIYQELPGVIPHGAWSSPAYFNGSVYEGGSGAAVFRFQFNSQAMLGAPSSQTTNNFGYPGATPTISSNGNSNGIVWAYENSSGQAVLHAYDATNLATELYNSSNVSIGGAVTFAVPTVCNGKVFVGTPNSIAAFGILQTQGSGVAKDFNNDGKADLIWENTSNGERVIWTLNNGVPIPNSSIALPTVSPTWHIAAVGDFLGNGQSDLVLQNTSTNECVIWILNNGVLQYGIEVATFSAGWHVAGAGDFNGDGFADLVLENTNTGEHLIWLLKSGVYSSSISLPTASPAWHIAGVGDFLGNSQSDLVLQNTITNECVIWILSNGVLQHGIEVATFSAGRQVAGAADFNSDGQADLVLQNIINGQRLIWLLNSGVRSSTITLPTVDISWTIVDH